MARNVARHLIEPYLASGTAQPGSETGLPTDKALTQDAEPRTGVPRCRFCV